MVVAVPIKNDKSCGDIESCDSIAIYKCENNRIQYEKSIEAPSYKIEKTCECLADLHVDLLIMGAVDAGFQDYLKCNKVQVITGAPVASPQLLVEFYTI